jgi:hypothetical protein
MTRGHMTKGRMNWGQTQLNQELFHHGYLAGVGRVSRVHRGISEIYRYLRLQCIGVDWVRTGRLQNNQAAGTMAV